MTSRYPVAFLLFSLVAGGICVRLGFWQLDRLAGRRAATAAALAQRNRPAVEFAALEGPAEHRRVIATGEYDFAREFVLRGRARDGVPGIEVATPLRPFEGDTAVLVLRGYVPSADAISYDGSIHREPDSATIAGSVMVLPDDSAGAAPSMRRGLETWRRLDLASVRARLPYPISPLYIMADSPATASPAPSRIRPPALDDGPHLNYAIQWFAFGSIAFGGAAALWWRRRQEPDG